MKQVPPIDSKFRSRPPTRSYLLRTPFQSKLAAEQVAKGHNAKDGNITATVEPGVNGCYRVRISARETK